MATDYKAKLAELNENNKKVFKAAGKRVMVLRSYIAALSLQVASIQKQKN